MPAYASAAAYNEGKSLCSIDTVRLGSLLVMGCGFRGFPIQKGVSDLGLDHGQIAARVIVMRCVFRQAGRRRRVTL